MICGTDRWTDIEECGFIFSERLIWKETQGRNSKVRNGRDNISRKKRAEIVKSPIS